MMMASADCKIFGISSALMAKHMALSSKGKKIPMDWNAIETDDKWIAIAELMKQMNILTVQHLPTGGYRWKTRDEQITHQVHELRAEDVEELRVEPDYWSFKWNFPYAKTWMSRDCMAVTRMTWMSRDRMVVT